MRTAVKNLLLNFIPRYVQNLVYHNHAEYIRTFDSHISFSQEGEDMVLRKLFNGRANGFYVDVGAHHPTLYSNTNHFYQYGWRGINIDATPGSKRFFEEKRKKDVNLELLVSESTEFVEFYLFEPSLMNTMSKEQVRLNEKFEWCELKDIINVLSVPLSKVLDHYLPTGKKVDFMSIDVEGSELTVLRSNNWNKYSPDVLLVEIIDMDFELILHTEVHQFLINMDYIFFAKTGNTVFYKKKGVFNF